MNKDRYSDQLEQLIKDKDVSALTTGEQELVIRELGSLEAYASLRSMASRSQHVLNRETITPSGSVLGNILARVEAVTKPVEKKIPFYERPLPLYQAAAAVALAMGLTWLWAQTMLNQTAEPVVITLVDTVYQEVVQVDTLQPVSVAKPIPNHITQVSPQRPNVKSGSVASTTHPVPDFRFSRGDFPVQSADRRGKNFNDVPQIFPADSMMTQNLSFISDRMM